MKEYTPIEKDTILRCFYLGVSVNYQSCQDIINILVSDGYVVLRTSVNGRAYHITDKGKGFILQGPPHRAQGTPTDITDKGKGFILQGRVC